MNKKFLSGFIQVVTVISCVVIGPQLHAAPDALDLMTKAEVIRNPQENYICSVILVDKEKGKTKNHRYQVSVKGRDKALVEFIEPIEDKGTRVLMVDAEMFVFVPKTAKPLRVSASQKLAGNAAYGDVTRINFIGNYTPVYLRADMYEGRKAEVLDLTSIPGRLVTYDRIEYWIDNENHRPLRTIYKTSSGKILREGNYADYRDVFGILRPNQFTITDALDTTHVTSLRFFDATRSNLSDAIFQKQNMNRK